MAAAIAATGAASAQQLPSGGTVTSGSATISQSGPNLLVTQTSRNAILSWQSFSVGGSASAHFENGTGATLNRVTGNLPSSIDGSLTATGSLYLINPAGVAVGTGGMVRTGGSFIASTHDTRDADFLDGGDLTLKGDSKAGVVNRGVIVSQSGDVVLTARRVENSGHIDAPNGSVGLLGGYEVELRDTSLADGKFAVKVGGSDTEVVNSGSIRAAEAELRANGGNVQALAGNTGKIIKATGVKKVGGRVFLTAGDGGSVAVTQRIVARRAVQPAGKVAVAALPDLGPLPAARPDFSGGEVHVAGSAVSLGGTIDTAGSGGAGGTITATAAGGTLSLSSTAALEASGDSGGLILLGGDYQGGSNPASRYLDKPLARAASATVEAGATIAANGAAGNGGNVVVWSDGKTSFAGAISATGGSRGGKGGNAEVSGKAVLAYTGFTDLSAANGSFGTLLLDPYNVTISNGTDSLGSGPGFTANANDSVINAATLQTALAGANVVVSTGSGGGQAGDITVAAPISWSSGSMLTLDAYRSIAIDAPVTIGGAGGLGLVTNHGGSGGTLSFAGGVQYTGTPGSGQSLYLDGQPYTLLYSMSDLQGINNGLNGRYALARSLDATGLTGWVPLGTNGAGTILNNSNGFAGTFDGLGNTVSNLNVDIGSYNFAGLFGYSTGAISDIGLIGGAVKGANYVGGLVGFQYGGGITQAYASGWIYGTADYVGGLVGGQLGGDITRAYAAGQVNGVNNVGGLVGYLHYAAGQQQGSITQAYATGPVNGVRSVGGFVGYQGSGSISQAYATGQVSGDSNVGGLVGYQGSGSIMQAYATGQVTGDYQVGGLVGYQGSGSIMQAYATGQVTGDYVAGGLVGGLYGFGSIITQAYAAGRVTGDSYVGGLVGYQFGGSITQAYATGQVTGAHEVGGLVGLRNAGSVDSSYFDTFSTGQTTASGASSIAGGSSITAVTSDPAQAGAANSAYNQAAYSGLSFTTTPGGSGWYMIDGQTRPFGAWEYSQNIVNGHQLQLVDMDLNASYRLARGIDLGPDLASATVNGNITYAGMWRLGSFLPLGTDGANSLLNNSNGFYGGFAGKFDGLGNTVSNLNVDIGGYSFAGLFGYSTGAIHDVGLIGGAVRGADLIGGLVGYQSGGSIERAYATGQVTGTGTVGGLVGYLVDGMVTQAYAAGQVIGVYSVGGLVGDQHRSNITQAYAIGQVTGSYYVGGLVGRQEYGTIAQAYADVQVAGNVTVGGLVGSGDTGSITQAYATGQVKGSDNVGGLVGYQFTGSISQAYATGKVEGSSHVGGLVGDQFATTFTSTYFDMDKTEQAFGVDSGSQAGITALSSVSGSAFVKDSYAGFDWTAWAPASAAAGSSPAYYPELFGVSGVVGVDFGNATITYGDTASSLSAPSAIYGIGYFNQWTTAPGAGTVASTNAGTYAVSSSGTAATFTPGGQSRIVNLGTLTITPATLTVAANAASKVYGNLDPTLSYTASGFKFSDDETLLSGALSRAAGENVGSYGIGQGSLAAGGNYTIAYTGANLAITPATLTVAANAASKVYGNLDPTLGYTASGFKFSDDETLLSGALGRAAGENVGNYAIGRGSLAAGGNYTIAYTGSNLAITPATLTVAANAASKVYGNLDPTLGYTASGFKFSDNASVLSGALSRAAGENVGNYAIGRGSLAAGGNYTIAYTGANLAITPRAITVTADNQRRLQGQPDPALTWTVIGGSLASFDTVASVFSGNLARDPGEAAGTYGINQGFLGANSNYALTFVAGTFTIEPAQTAAQYTNAQALERRGDQNAPPFPSPLLLPSLLLSEAVDDGATATCSTGVLGPECVAFVHPANRDLGPYIGATE